MPLLLLYRAPSFGCSSFFVYRGLCKNRSIDVCGRPQYVIREFIWTAPLMRAKIPLHSFFSRENTDYGMHQKLPSKKPIRTCVKSRVAAVHTNLHTHVITTYCIHVCPRTSVEQFLYTALCTQRTKSSQSLVRGTAIVEAWVYYNAG